MTVRTAKRVTVRRVKPSNRYTVRRSIVLDGRSSTRVARWRVWDGQEGSWYTFPSILPVGKLGFKIKAHTQVMCYWMNQSNPTVASVMVKRSIKRHATKGRTVRKVVKRG